MAYGHSLELCAPAAVRAGAQWLGVTSVEEAVTARSLCPDAGILVMSGCFPGEGLAVVEHNLTPVVWEPWHLDELEGAARAAGLGAGSLSVHLEIDTGMSRQGASLEGWRRFWLGFRPDSALRIEVCSPTSTQRTRRMNVRQNCKWRSWTRR